MKQIKNMISTYGQLTLIVMATIVIIANLAPGSVQKTLAQKQSSPSKSSEIVGRFVGRGVTCLRFRLNSGETVSLAGKRRGIRGGKGLKLRGKWAAISNCMQGRTFVVEEIVVGG